MLAKKSDSVSEPKTGHVSEVKLDNPGDYDYNLSHMEISSVQSSSIFSINGVSLNTTKVSEEDLSSSEFVVKEQKLDNQLTPLYGWITSDDPVDDRILMY